MKFVFISTMNDSPWGGSEELWSQAAIQLRQAGHQVQAFVAECPQPSPKLANLEKHSIRVQMYPSRQSGPSRRVWNALSRGLRRAHLRLRSFQPDLVVISQGYNAGGFDWAATCRDAALPYVIVVHCNSEMWWFQEQLPRAIESYTGASKVLCVCQSNLDLLRLQLGEPLVDAEIVRNPWNVSPGIAPSWPEESGVWRLACVARMDPAAKGQDLLLQTLARPEWRDCPVELNFFGSGPDEPCLRRMAERFGLENVHFRGHVSDVASIWQNHHLLVLPSRFEGLPLALVEAMWCRRPAVVTEVGGNAELCVDGETGFVAQAPTVPFFAEALRRAWERRHDWQRMGEAARILAETQIPQNPVALFCDRLENYAGCSMRSTLP